MVEKVTSLTQKNMHYNCAINKHIASFKRIG